MCSKIARFRARVGASLTAAPDQACRLATKVGIDLLGYVRTPDTLVLYTQGTRIKMEDTVPGRERTAPTGCGA